MNTYEKVKKYADENATTIAAIEAAAGVANGTIAGWKSGRPYAETLHKVAGVIKCQIEDLLPDR